MDFDILSKIDIAGLMEKMEKYKNIDMKSVKMTIEKYDNAMIMKIISDSNQLGDIVTDILPLMLGEIPPENLKIIDKRG